MRAEREAFRESEGGISVAVGTAAAAVPMLDFEIVTHKKLRGRKIIRISTAC